jgi:hypothetical protein
MTPATTDQALYRLMEGSADRSSRGHLGASIIGDSCARKLWYGFHWVFEPWHEGRILRLFRRGQVEESFLESDLNLLPGVTVRTIDPATGEQYRWTDPELPGFSGSCDGVAYGLPEAPEEWIGLEFKTHSDKNFKLLKKNGVEKAYKKHFYQCQTYMFWSGLPAFLYVGVNKNTDELYTELIEYDETAAHDARVMAREVLESTKAPPKISKRADWYECKFCSFWKLCHQNEKPIDNCRTCEKSTYNEREHEWTCQPKRKSLNILDQRNGCESHELNPAIWIAE